jgi:hypothetical protein
MRNTAKTLYLAALVLMLPSLTGNSSYAQQTAAVTDSERQAGNNFFSSFASAELAFDARGLVQNAPFSALATKETTQILSDGRRLERRMTARLYRDSAGSMRVERAIGEMPIPAIIYEAGSGALIFINPESKRAQRLLPPAEVTSGERKPNIVTPQSPPDDITRAAGETVESLGTQVIEGLRAEGVRVTSPVPATANGGRTGRVVYERWYSQELRRTLLIKVTDPRFGEAVFRLTAINRNEPSRALFEIPADYKVSDEVFPRPARAVKSGYSK